LSDFRKDHSDAWEKQEVVLANEERIQDSLPDPFSKDGNIPPKNVFGDDMVKNKHNSPLSSAFSHNAPKDEQVFQGSNPVSFHRKPFAWRCDSFYDKEEFIKELRRVFDICHTCRRCFNLCGMFPKLFRLIDDSPTGELDSVSSQDLLSVLPECTLCDMCFMAKCPYVPPHPWNVDLPHLVVRHRAIQRKSKQDLKTKVRGLIRHQLAQTDRNGKACVSCSCIVNPLMGGPNPCLSKESGALAKDFQESGLKQSCNKGSGCGSGDACGGGVLGLDQQKPVKKFKISLKRVLDTLCNTLIFYGHCMVRWALGQLVKIHPKARLPGFNTHQFTQTWRNSFFEKNAQGKNSLGNHHKVVIYTGCFVEYQGQSLGKALQGILELHGIIHEFVYPGCCGMPLLEQGDLHAIAALARTTSACFKPWIDKGYKILSIVPSCTLMMRSEWPLMLPEEPEVALLAQHTWDVSAYLLDLFKKGHLTRPDILYKKNPLWDDGGEEGQPSGDKLPGTIGFHSACHARAQNQGKKSLELLQGLFPNNPITLVERCSGHGGLWGYEKEHFESALDLAQPVVQGFKPESSKQAFLYIASECPLALSHLEQAFQESDTEPSTFKNDSPEFLHPLEIIYRGYQNTPRNHGAMGC
jgi:glycerol-3-phosphate dehydrogenase subunit C